MKSATVCLILGVLCLLHLVDAIADEAIEYKRSGSCDVCK